MSSPKARASRGVSDNTAVSQAFRTAARVAGRTLAVVGTGIILFCGWLMAGGSSGLERFVTESDQPRPSQAIVCLTGGLDGHALPTEDGWDRICADVQLQADGLAPTIVFSGGGPGRVSEAEVYAEAARWLGCPREAIVLEPLSASTAEHPRNLLRLGALGIRRDTLLLVVTSRLHSKRAALCFRKAGFTNVRLVTSYEARRSPLARSRMRSEVRSFVPNRKSYGDPLNRLRWGLNDAIFSLRELVAIAVYRYRGQA
jgi:uncharacterized SAM-binding protein YcdF (DUF218 family)